MKGSTLRVIHVGVGRRGTWPLQVVAETAGWRSVALVDIDPGSLAKAAEATGLGKACCFRSLGEAAQAVEADVAIICTPTRHHAEICRQALGAGLHVLVEKGMTNDLGAARELVAAAADADLCLCVSQNYRYLPQHRALKEALAAGQVGQPAFFDHIHHRRRPDPLTLSYPDALLWDMACHHLDCFVDWFGPIKAVNARLYSAPWSRYQHPAAAVAWLEFESGVFGNYGLSFIAQANSRRLEIHTTTGRVRLRDVENVTFDGLTADGPATLDLPEGPRSEQFVLDAFGRYIREGVEPPISGQANLAVLETIAAIIESNARGGTRVELAET